MEYIFENIGNLDKAHFTVEKGKVNIKYGFNGIGKSTIVKALNYIYGDETERIGLENIILSYRTNAEKILPTQIKNDFDELLVYDRKYFDGLFKQTDLLNNTYEFIIDSVKYKSLLNPIVEKIEKIKNFINNSNYSQLVNILNFAGERQLIQYKANGKDVVKSKSILYYYASKNIRISADIPTELDDYSTFIESGFRTEWYKWLSGAKEEWYKDGNRCPFCGTLHNTSLHNRINLLKGLKNKNEYSDYDKEQSFVSSISKYINGDLSSEISSINYLNTKADSLIIKPLNDGLDFVKRENLKIQYFLSLSGKALVDSLEKQNAYDNLSTLFQANKLSNDFFLADNNDANIVSSINAAIDDLISDLSNLKKIVGQLKSEITSRINTNKDLINDFLKVAGMPYNVDIKQSGDTLFETLFSYNGNANIISNQLSYLSYGEANALALLLFCIEVKTKDNALIVFDDPVSSFDNNKRYAIYDYLFNNKNGKRLMWGKTSIIFTHDFDTVLAFSNCFPLCEQDIATFAYCSLMNYELSEKFFSRKDIVNTLGEYEKVAKDLLRPKITRVVAARHCCEIKLEKGSDPYKILSSLIHGRKIPSKDMQEKDLYSNLELHNNDEAIKEYLGNDYEYSDYYNEISNTSTMKSIYFNSKTTKFDKICIARCLLSSIKESSIENSVIWNFLSEVFHVEKDSIYSIKDFEIFDVPDYIISLCDKIVSNIF